MSFFPLAWAATMAAGAYPKVLPQPVPAETSRMLEPSVSGMS